MYQFELKPSRNAQWQKELEKFFDVFSDNETHFAPACEIHDEDKMYSISLDIPGIAKEDIQIEVKDNHLHVYGERKATKTTAFRSEKRYGKFSRVFSLPQNVDTDAIEATFVNGVLQLTQPKAEKSQTKKIQISGWNQDLKN